MHEDCWAAKRNEFLQVYTK